MLAMLAAATAEEFWRGRDEPLMSRWPTVIVLLAYAAALLARIPATYFSPMLDDHSLMSGVSFALLAFGTLLFTVVMAFLLLNMTKERTELQHKINALVDPLSGVANRRASSTASGRLFAQQAVDHEPLAMLLFDLDRFKAINDRLRPRGRRPGAADLRRDRDHDARAGRPVRPHRRRGVRLAACRSAISARPLRSPTACAAISPTPRRASPNDDLVPTVSVGVTLGLRRARPRSTICWSSPTRRSTAPRPTAAIGSRRPRRDETRRRSPRRRSCR